MTASDPHTAILDEIRAAGASWNDEPPVALVKAARRAGAALVPDLAALLADPDEQVRRNTLWVIETLGTKAAALAWPVVVSVLGTRELDGVATFVLPKLLTSRALKQFAADHLVGQTDIRILAVAQDLLRTLPAAEQRRIDGIARRSIEALDGHERVHASQVLIAVSTAADALAGLYEAVRGASPERLAGIVRGVGSLYAGKPSDARRRAFVRKHLDHEDEHVRAASLEVLGGLGLADKEWPRLVAAAQSSSPALRRAAAYALTFVDVKHRAEAEALIAAIRG